jgi:dTDP-glucose 4,6-dehydratase
LGGENLTVFGDGSQTRSFCYVSDLIEGIYRLLLSEEWRPVNIGNPHEISLLDFAKEIIALSESSSEVVFKPLPQDDPKQRQPDISRAREVLGWVPVISRKEGLRLTYAYFKKQLADIKL